MVLGMMQLVSAPDALSQEIADLELAALQKERELELVRIELKALKRAAELRPISYHEVGHGSVAHAQSYVVRSPHHGGPRGKLAGTINNTYRETMRRVVEEGNNYLTPDLWAVASKECGYELSVKAARDWLFRGGGAKSGYVERSGNSYRVSALAIDRFGFKRPERTVGKVSLFSDEDAEETSA
jgi:hypothetical protein